jgi:hypothetical protein
MENSGDSCIYIHSEQHGFLAISPSTFKRAKGRLERQSTVRNGIIITSPRYPNLLLTRREFQRAAVDYSKEIDRVRRSEIEDKVKGSKRLSRQRNAGLLVEAKRAFYEKEDQGLN